MSLNNSGCDFSFEYKIRAVLFCVVTMVSEVWLLCNTFIYYKQHRPLRPGTEYNLVSRFCEKNFRHGVYLFDASRIVRMFIKIHTWPIRGRDRLSPMKDVARGIDLLDHPWTSHGSEPSEVETKNAHSFIHETQHHENHQDPRDDLAMLRFLEELGCVTN